MQKKMNMLIKTTLWTDSNVIGDVLVLHML